MSRDQSLSLRITVPPLPWKESGTIKKITEIELVPLFTPAWKRQLKPPLQNIRS
jgi:hypothetical protein